MIEFSETEKKMILKLVYYGPALSGKTTNLLKLHDMIEGGGRGDLMILDTKDDRTIFFDLLPLCWQAHPGGLTIKIKLFTVPGHVKHDATRKAVLQGADGVAFIADSRISERKNNAESFENLETNLTRVGLSAEKTPLVVQFNKRDLPDVVSEDVLARQWGPTGLPVTMACAFRGGGVMETFRLLLERVFDRLSTEYSLEKEYGVTRGDFLRGVGVSRVG
jgi:signal recognition particle receptor subunit beta